MSEDIHREVLLELALSLGGDPRLSELLARTLPLVLRRTDSVYVGLVRLDARGPRTELVVPRVLAEREEWDLIVAAAVERRPVEDGTTSFGSHTDAGGEHIHLFDLPGVGVLVVGRAEPFDPRFVVEFRRFVDVLTRACVAGIEHERRREVETELIEVQDRQRALLDNLPFAAWMTDANGRLTLSNGPFAAAAGTSSASTLDRTVDAVLPRHLGGAAAEVTNTALERAAAVTREHDHPADQAVDVAVDDPELEQVEVRTIEHHAGPIRSRSGRVLGVTGYLRDVTARVVAERRLEEQAVFQRLLMDLAVGFVNVPLAQLDDAIERALATTGAFTAVDRAYLFRYDLERGTTSNTHEWCAPGVAPMLNELQELPLDSIPEWLDRHLRGEVLHIPSVGQRPVDDPIRAILDPQGVETVITVPLFDGERCLGFVGFDVVGRRREWTDDELALLSVLAELFTNAQVRREREDATVAARREAEVAEERLALALSATHDAIFDHDIASDRVHVSSRWWQLLGLDDGPSEIAASEIGDRVHPEDRASLWEEYSAALASTATMAQLEYRLQHRDGYDVPVVSRIRIIRDADGAPTRAVGINLDVTERRRREAATRRQLELESTLANVSARFVGLDAFDAALDAALADIARLCGAGRATVVTADAEGRLGVADRQWRDADAPAPPTDAPILPEMPWVERRLRAGEMVHLPDLGAVEPSDAIAARGAFALLLVPLLVGGELVGVIGLEHLDAMQVWSDGDIAAVRSAAEVVAGALARARAESELRANERDHRRTVEHLLEVVFRIDADGRWTYLNPVWEELTGWPARDVLGVPAASCFHPDDRDQLLVAADGAGDEVVRDELRLLTRDGDLRWVEVVRQPERDDDGAVIGVVGSFNDVTERRANELALVEAKQAAEAANEAKTRFISTVSHELRTPMNGVIGMLELLLARPVDETAQDYARAARRSAASLLTLVDDLLDIAKIEAGRLELDRTPVDLRELAHDVREVVAAAAAEQELTLTVDVATDVPDLVLADPVRLRQLLINLLGNAVKFTEDGAVSLRVAARERRADARVPLVLTVADTGIGIAAEDLARLFDPFTQADQSTNRRFGGTGLGLAIVRQLTELMGGHIEVESSPGEGTTFRLELDLDIAAAMSPTHGGERDREQEVPCHGRRVLVVEDNDINQALARAHLEDLGCEVTIADDGAAGADLALTRPFDLVLMDCLMPGVDGFEGTRRIREGEPDGQRIPVVALTADATAEHAAVCRDVGMDDVLTKPYGQADLAAVLHRMGARTAPEAGTAPDPAHEAAGQPLRSPGPRPRHAEPAVSGGPPSGTDDGGVFDPKPLDALRRDVADPALVGRVIRTYAARTPGLVEQLAHAVRAQDATAMRTATHALTSSSASVGAVEVERLTLRIAEETSGELRGETSGALSGATSGPALVDQLRRAVARVLAEHERYLGRPADVNGRGGST